jgi:hypothetical protein
MIRPHATSALASAFALALLDACGTAAPSGEVACVGTDCAEGSASDADVTEQIDVSDTAGTDAVTTVDADEADAVGDGRDGDTGVADAVTADVSVDSDDTTPDADPGCPGVANACGGCATLAEVVGTVCGSCGDGFWACDGADAVLCQGGDDEPVSWWPDLDGDDRGDAGAEPTVACERPFPAAVTNADDCNDLEPRTAFGLRESCDGIDNDCDSLVDDPPEDGCADACCDAFFVCDEGACLPPCESERCGPDRALCCDFDEVCLGDECVVSSATCETSDDCDVDEYCEPTIAACVPDGRRELCEYRPPSGVFSPAVECRWDATGLAQPSYRDIVSTPAVANLTDDNGDGFTDTRDTPDIAFLTYNYPNGCCNVAAALRIVSGSCGSDGTAITLATIDTPQLTNDAGIAIADLDNDGVNEIVAITRRSGNPQGTVAFRRTSTAGTAWEVMWENTTYPTWNVHTRGGAVISVADLDANGFAEVVIGNVALNGQDGTLLWDGRATVGTSAGIGNNAFLGPTSAVGDMDLDGFQEVMAGNTLYEYDGTEQWTYTYTTNNSACGGDLTCDGFAAMANMDDDAFGEAVVIRRGEAFIFNHDGTLLWKRPIPKAGCANNESGPPTVADFDGDGRPEIGTASADYYVVLDQDCSGSPAPAGCAGDGILWRVTNEDCSSRATASSVFDFESDGAAEVIYADEVSLRIFDGRTGTVLFSDSTYRSHTRIEMPVIADVDNDGNAEIVVGRNRNGGGTPGLQVWGDASDNWVRTRRIWNQHGYSITNVTETGAIPASPDVNWNDPRYNNYRQNVQPTGPFDAPDLLVSELDVAATGCPVYSLLVAFTVTNAGAIGVPAGVSGSVEFVRDGVGELAETFVTSHLLLPGDSERIAFEVLFADEPTSVPFDVRVMIDDSAAINECDEANNIADGIGRCPI